MLRIQQEKHGERVVYKLTACQPRRGLFPVAAAARDVVLPGLRHKRGVPGDLFPTNVLRHTGAQRFAHARHIAGAVVKYLPGAGGGESVRRDRHPLTPCLRRAEKPRLFQKKLLGRLDAVAPVALTAAVLGLDAQKLPRQAVIERGEQEAVRFGVLRREKEHAPRSVAVVVGELVVVSETVRSAAAESGGETRQQHGAGLLNRRAHGRFPESAGELKSLHR